MSDTITIVEVAPSADGVETVEINVPGLQGAKGDVGPASVFHADTYTGEALPAALTLRPIAEGSAIYGLYVTTPE